MSSPPRVLLFHEGDVSTGESLRSRLAGEGFDVALARTFLEAAPFLAPGRTDLFLFYLPEKEWVRNAMLTEVRRANPRLPIIAMVPNAADDLLQFLARFHVASVVPTRGNWQSTVESVRNVLASTDPATEETQSEGGKQ